MRELERAVDAAAKAIYDCEPLSRSNLNGDYLGHYSWEQICRVDPRVRERYLKKARAACAAVQLVAEEGIEEARDRGRLI